MLASSKTRRRIYSVDENDIVEGSSMQEGHYQDWLAEGLAPTDTTRELIGYAARVVRMHEYQSPSNAIRQVWVAEESHPVRGD